MSSVFCYLWGFFMVRRARANGSIASGLAGQTEGGDRDKCRDGPSRRKGRAPSFSWDFGRVSRTPRALLPVSAGGGTGASHNPRTLSRPAFATSDQPLTAEHSGAAAPGAARPCDSQRPPGPRPGLQRSLPARPAPPRSPPVPGPGPSPAPVPLPPPARREPHAARPAPRGLWLAVRSDQ